MTCTQLSIPNPSSIGILKKFARFSETPNNPSSPKVQLMPIKRHAMHVAVDTTDLKSSQTRSVIARTDQVDISMNASLMSTIDSKTVIGAPVASGSIVRSVFTNDSSGANSQRSIFGKIDTSIPPSGETNRARTASGKLSLNPAFAPNPICFSAFPVCATISWACVCATTRSCGSFNFRSSWVSASAIFRRGASSSGFAWSEASASICPNRLRTLSTKAPVSSFCWTGFALKEPPTAAALSGKSAVANSARSLILSALSG